MEKPDRIPTVGGPLEIQPVDHASMVLRHGAQTIYVDPVGGAARYAGLARPSAILVTHHHGDHLDTATLEGLVGTKAVPMLVSAGVLERLPAALKAQSRAVRRDRYGRQIGIRLMQFTVNDHGHDAAAVLRPLECIEHVALKRREVEDDETCSGATGRPHQRRVNALRIMHHAKPRRDRRHEMPRIDPPPNHRREKIGIGECPVDK